MSVWELAACSEGFRKANEVDPDPPAPTVEEYEAMVAADFYVVNPHLTKPH